MLIAPYFQVATSVSQVQRAEQAVKALKKARVRAAVQEAVNETKVIIGELRIFFRKNASEEY